MMLNFLCSIVVIILFFVLSPPSSWYDSSILKSYFWWGFEMYVLYWYILTQQKFFKICAHRIKRTSFRAEIRATSQTSIKRRIGRFYTVFFDHLSRSLIDKKRKAGIERAKMDVKFFQAGLCRGIEREILVLDLVNRQVNLFHVERWIERR